MTFYINHSDGSNLAVIQDGTLDTTSTALTLVGKNFPTYGQYMNQNFVNLLENFANSSAPNNPQIGQIWYDSSNNVLKMYRPGSTSPSWKKVAVTAESATAPTDPRAGDIWWDTTNIQLKIYDAVALQWRIIGPQTTSNGKLAVPQNNNFTLTIGGNSYFIVDNNGGVTKPFNPVVSGYDHATATTPINTGGISSYDVWKPKLISDAGNNFNDQGEFHINTAGQYKVYFHCSIAAGTTTGIINLNWCVNSNIVKVNAYNNFYGEAVAGTVTQMVCSGIVPAYQGDNIKLIYSTDADATSAILPTNSSYSIELIG